MPESLKKKKRWQLSTKLSIFNQMTHKTRYNVGNILQWKMLLISLRKKTIQTQIKNINRVSAFSLAVVMFSTLKNKRPRTSVILFCTSVLVSWPCEGSAAVPPLSDGPETWTTCCCKPGTPEVSVTTPGKTTTTNHDFKKSPGNF